MGVRDIEREAERDRERQRERETERQRETEAEKVVLQSMRGARTEGGRIKI